METYTIEVGTTPVALTNGTQDYFVHVEGQIPVLFQISDSVVTNDSDMFKLDKGKGFTSITHPGKVWAMSSQFSRVGLVKVGY